MNKLTLKNSLLSGLLVSALILSGWAISVSQKTSHIKRPTSQPDAYMENVVATIIDKHGNPSLKIASPKMVHYVENDTTQIAQPHVTVYRNSPQPWYIDSDSGKAVNGTDEIIFINHVVIHHPADSTNPNTVMKTASLTVFPEKQTADTPDPVLIKQPDATVHAVGMLANLNNGTIQLLSQAKGEYAAS